jgi:isopentenyl-diphosphate Delta-isomerase
LTQEQTSKRKSDHIDLALRSQLQTVDSRFMYEPLLGKHPVKKSSPFEFLGKKMSTPIWASSMTGGAEHAGDINRNLARVSGKYGLGMGLGSCRIILQDNTHLSDFTMRKLLGDDVPFFANLGIAQIEEIVSNGQINLIHELIDKTETDGLIIHVNPIQEWLQPEGDVLTTSSIETISSLIDSFDKPLIVKEVGQGMGIGSLRALMELPLAAIDFGAFGGTNFSLLELLRGQEINREAYSSLANIGHTAEEMVGFCNLLYKENAEFRSTEVIISGGVSNFLDGYYLMNKLNSKSVYGQASALLKPAAQGYDFLDQFVETQIRGLELAKEFLRIKE